MQQTEVQPLGWEDPLEEEIATHSSILAWEIPWTEEPGTVHRVAKSQTGLSAWACTHVPFWAPVFFPNQFKFSWSIIVVTCPHIPLFSCPLLLYSRVLFFNTTITPLKSDASLGNRVALRKHTTSALKRIPLLVGGLTSVPSPSPSPALLKDGVAPSQTHNSSCQGLL